VSRKRQLEWFPLYPERFISDKRYRLLADFQQAWYFNLMVACWSSHRPGWIRDEELWRVAGARNEEFFKQHSAPVLARFERIVELDGTWIHHLETETLYQEQCHKRRRSA